MASAFSYVAIDRAGRRHRAVGEAPSSSALERDLRTRGLVLLEASPADHDPAARQRGLRGSSKREVLELTRTLAALLHAGLPLRTALETAETLAIGETAGVLASVRRRVEQGSHLAAALAGHPALFSPLYLGLVRAGERSGDLAGAFGRLEFQLERDERLRARLLSVSLYPLLLGLAGGTAVLVLLFFVVPRFVELLQDTGAVLPASTSLLLTVSSALRSGWPFLVLLVLALGLLAAWVRSTDDGKRAGSHVLLRFPGIGGLRRQALAARFARLLATLVGGGAPVIGALDDTIECLNDPLAREEVVRIRSRVREGATLHSAIAAGDVFPPLLGRLVAVGDESGRLHEFLIKSADMMEDRTTRAVERLVALAEPGMILVFGGLVGFVALSLLQAIYSINADSFR